MSAATIDDSLHTVLTSLNYIKGFILQHVRMWKSYLCTPHTMKPTGEGYHLLMGELRILLLSN